MQRKKIKSYIFPVTVLLASLYASAIFAIGAIIGYISTDIFCKKYVHTKKVKTLEFSFKGWEIHLHHWLTGGVIIIFAYLSGLINSMPIIVLGVLGGLVFHDIHTDKKLHENDIAWYNVIYRK